MQLNSGEYILKALLKTAARLESIFFSSKRLHNNCVLTIVVAFGIKMKKERITRNFGNMLQSSSTSISSSSSTLSSLSKSTSHKQCSKIGSRNKKKKAVKLHEKLKKIITPIISDYGSYYSNSD